MIGPFFSMQSYFQSTRMYDMTQTLSFNHKLHQVNLLNASQNLKLKLNLRTLNNWSIHSVYLHMLKEI